MCIGSSTTSLGTCLKNLRNLTLAPMKKSLMKKSPCENYGHSGSLGSAASPPMPTLVLYFISPEIKSSACINLRVVRLTTDTPSLQGAEPSVLDMNRSPHFLIQNHKTIYSTILESKHMGWNGIKNPLLKKINTLLSYSKTESTPPPCMPSYRRLVSFIHLQISQQQSKKTDG